MERRKIVLDLPLPPKECHPNSRCHWAVKAKAVKKARATAALLAKAAMIGKPFKRASLHMHFYNARRNDSDNLISACKAVFDGLQGIVIENDSGFIIHPPLQASGKASGGKRGLVLTVIEEPT